MNRKFAYYFYALFAVLLICAVIVAAVVLRKEEPENPPSDSSSAAPEGSSAETVPEMTEEITAAERTAEISTAEITTAGQTTAEITTAEITAAESTGPLAPETTAPETTAPETTAPETTAPETTAPETTAPETTAPETTPPETTPPETTSPETVPPETEPVTDTFTLCMSFAGDTQLADNEGDTNGRFKKAWDARSPSYFLEKVRYIFAQDDYTLVNLECVISDRDLAPTPKAGSAYWYKGKTEYLGAILSSSIEAVSLVNNHVNDYGEEGYADTLQCVLSSGFEAATYDDILYYTKNGYTVAVICEGLWNYAQCGTIIRKIHDAEQKSDFQVVYFHGADREYVYVPEEWKIQACHDMVDAGADLVIGNHPHVLQPTETYNGVRIVYSLGNFCYGGMARYEKTTIIYQLVLTVGHDGLLLDVGEEIIPCYYWANACQPTVIQDEAAKQQVFDFLNGLCDRPMNT